MSQRRARDRWAGRAACAAGALPAIVSGARAVTGKWTPVIDDAVLAVKAQDASRGHLPLVGIYSSLSEAAHWPRHLYHPGPLELWVLAPFVRLFGPDGVGMAVGAAAINALAAAGVVWLARRRGGVAYAWLAAAVVVVLAWSVGGQVLHDPWNPHLAIFPGLLAITAAWGVAEGDERLLPLLVLAASAVAELHLTYVVPMVCVVLVAVGGLGLAAWRAEDRRAALVALRPWLAGGALVGVVCWSGPLVDQAFGDGNLWGLARASNAAGVARVGFGDAWRGLIHAIAIPPVWWHDDGALVRRQAPVSAWAVVTAAALVAALAVGTVRAWRRRRWSTVSGVTVTFAALAGATATVARTPAGFGYEQLLWARRVWWPVSAGLWLVVAWMVLVELAAVRQPVRRFVRTGVASASAALMVVASVALWPRTGVARDFGSAGFGPVRALGPASAAAASRPGRWLVASRGDMAAYVVAPGLVAQLVARGLDVVVLPAVNLDLGKRHRVGRQTIAGTLFVLSGAAASSPPPGAALVARWDPSTAPAPYRSYHETLFLVPVEPVAVYVVPEAGP